MILRTIFQSAAVTALHIGITAGIATSMGRENVAATAMTSFFIGMPALLAGTFAGHALTYKPDDLGCEQSPGAIIGGIIGYVTGSAIGFALQ